MGGAGLEPATPCLKGSADGFVPSRSKSPDPRWIEASRQFADSDPALLHSPDFGRLGHEWGTGTGAWSPGDTIPLGRDRTLRVIDVRPALDCVVDHDDVELLEVEEPGTRSMIERVEGPDVMARERGERFDVLAHVFGVVSTFVAQEESRARAVHSSFEPEVRVGGVRIMLADGPFRQVAISQV